MAVMMMMMIMIIMMMVIWQINFFLAIFICNIVDHSLTSVEAIVLKRHWYRKKWLLRHNGRGFESKENSFEGDFKFLMHR